MSLVVIGASWGGLRALQLLLRALPTSYPHSLAIAQHRAQQSEDLAEVLAHDCALPVRDADDKEPRQPGVVYLAPPDYHLLIDGPRFALAVDEPVCHSRPSIDVLFESAAEEKTHEVIAIILTGANEDGARGVQRIKATGGTVIAQDPREAEAATMPRAAIATGAVDYVMTLAEISEYLRRI